LTNADERKPDARRVRRAQISLAEDESPRALRRLSKRVDGVGRLDEQVMVSSRDMPRLTAVMAFGKLPNSVGQTSPRLLTLSELQLSFHVRSFQGCVSLGR
jgi:hypothetical protein